MSRNLSKGWGIEIRNNVANNWMKSSQPGIMIKEMKQKLYKSTHFITDINNTSKEYANTAAKTPG